jgi:hypothetical protein
MYFTREEIKYQITSKIADILMCEFNKRLTPDMFPKYKVHTIYYDNDNDGIITHSIQKPVIFKEKLRLRFYENNNVLNPFGYFELKRKYDGTVYKKRIKLSPSQAEELLQGKSALEVLDETQISIEILAFLKRTNAKPKIYIGFERHAYEEKPEMDLRVTLDTDIASRRKGLGLRSSTLDVPLFLGKTFVLEIKSSLAYPMWLAELLSKHKIYPIPFSKWGAIYEKELLEAI